MENSNAKNFFRTVTWVLALVTRDGLIHANCLVTCQLHSKNTTFSYIPLPSDMQPQPGKQYSPKVAYQTLLDLSISPILPIITK